nr:Chain C, ELR peptide from IAV [Influenza A virus]7NUI_D Chain D, GLU-LEU-ARG-SER-ARG-TYR-TRP-ALA-ILE [Influenza A virus]
ELRSRYWAI